MNVFTSTPALIAKLLTQSVSTCFAISWRR